LGRVILATSMAHHRFDVASEFVTDRSDMKAIAIQECAATYSCSALVAIEKRMRESNICHQECRLLNDISLLVVGGILRSKQRAF